MGEISDWVLEGGLCQECGEYLGEGDGFPTSCPGCAALHENHKEPESPAKPKTTKFKCPLCERHIRAAGLSMHIRDVHGVT